MNIKLGRLSGATKVKVTVAMSRELKERIDSYAKLHSTTWGEDVDAATVIPAILEHFINSDRQFRKSERASC